MEMLGVILVVCIIAYFISGYVSKKLDKVEEEVKELVIDPTEESQENVTGDEKKNVILKEDQKLSEVKKKAPRKRASKKPKNSNESKESIAQ